MVLGDVTESCSIVKSLKKRVDNLSYLAGVARDYSGEIHYDPDKKERVKELDQIIKKINDITYYDFSEIIHNVNKLKIAIQALSEDSQALGAERQAQSEDSQALGAKRRAKIRWRN